MYVVIHTYYMCACITANICSVNDATSRNSVNALDQCDLIEQRGRQNSPLTK